MSYQADMYSRPAIRIQDHSVNIDRSNDLISIQNLYMKIKSRESTASSHGSRSSLREAVYNFLEKTQPSNRLPGFTRVVVADALSNPDTEVLKDLHRTFLDLESYALRLVWHPWKKQFWSIKVQSSAN